MMQTARTASDLLRLRRRLDRWRLRTIRAAHAADHWTREQEKTGQELQKLEASAPEFMNLDARTHLGHWLWLLLLPGLWGVDFLLLNPVYEFLLGMNFSNAFPLRVGQALVPGIIVLAEVLLLSERLKAHEKALEEEDDRALWARYGFLLALSVMLGITVPAGTVAFLSTVWDGLPAISRYALTYVCLALSLVGHSLVTFAGDSLLDALAYASFRFKHGRLTRRMKRAQKLHHQYALEAVDSMRCYLHVRKLYQEAGGEVQDGFDNVTLQVLRDQGVKIILADQPAATLPPPSSPPANPAPPTNPGPTGQNGDVGDEVEYYHRILAGRIREEEGEVRP
ncbi:MAG: hypothetical protein QXT77_00090 [Candidatus Methanomethylicaceae archaeon]